MPPSAAPLSPELQRLEHEVRARVAGGDVAGAVARALEVLGPELLGFQTVLLGDASAADEAYSQLCEDLLRGLASFGWRCRLRTWLYTLARNAALRRQRDPFGRWAEALSAHPSLERPPRASHTTGARAREAGVTRLRARLSADEQALLTLRVDRGLEWQEVAEVLMPALERASPRARARATAALRKRFERLRGQLRRWALEEGLVEGG